MQTANHNHNNDHITPVQLYKIHIRTQHRHKLRKQIINQYQQMQSLQFMVLKINRIVRENIGIIVQKVQKRVINGNSLEKCWINMDIQAVASIWREVAPQVIIQSIYNNNTQCKQSAWNINEIISIIQQINRILSTMEMDYIQLVINQQQQLISTNNSNQDRHFQVNKSTECSRLKQKLTYLIRISIPYIMYIRNIISNTYIKTIYNNSNTMPNSRSMNMLQQHSIQILCMLSPIYYLRQCYTNYNNHSSTINIIQNIYNIQTPINTHHHINKIMHQYLTQQILQQPLILLLMNIKYFICPPNIFYKCLISIGNLLSTINNSNNNNTGGENSQKQQRQLLQRNNYYQGQEDKNYDRNNYEQEDQVQYYYKILLQNNIQSVMIGCLSIFNSDHHQQPQHNNTQYYYYNNYISNNNEQQVYPHDQQTIIWFMYVYTKMLYGNSMPIYDNNVLSSQIQFYIQNTLAKLCQCMHYSSNNINNTNNNNNINHLHPLSLSSSQLKQLKPLINILTYINMKPSNNMLYNIIIPMIRNNWEAPLMAKLWLWLTYNMQYDIDSVVNINGNINININGNINQCRSNNRNHYKNYPPSNSNSISNSNSKSKRAGCWDDQITVKANNRHKYTQYKQQYTEQTIVYSPTYQILSQIFQTIYSSSSFQSNPHFSSSSSSSIRRRNKDLLQSIYNMILNVQQKDAVLLWINITEEYCHIIQNIIIQQKGYARVIQQIQQYVTQCSHNQ